MTDNTGSALELTPSRSDVAVGSGALKVSSNLPLQMHASIYGNYGSFAMQNTASPTTACDLKKRAHSAQYGTCTTL